ncbi:MAG: dihydropteroate synthase [Devosiaceae bacterium]|nr:dihydropteroate synthase [Devosiaceae bacterium]
MPDHRAYNVPIKGGVLSLGPSPLIMGILNITPDSFSDGGEYFSLQNALTQTRAMLEQGADIIDIGGQSTRPGANEIDTKEELERVVPVIEHLILNGVKVPISIDTFRCEVAQRAVEAGAQIINDVTGLQREPEIAEVAAYNKTPLIAMHWDKTRNRDADLIGEMKRFFGVSLSIAEKAKMVPQSLILDPGFGFAKSFEENYSLLNRLDELSEFGFPLLVGTSRKSMLGKLLNIEPKERVAATVATSVIAYQSGAHIFRVHDVAPNLQALRVAMATCYGAPEAE